MWTFAVSSSLIGMQVLSPAARNVGGWPVTPGLSWRNVLHRNRLHPNPHLFPRESPQPRNGQCWSTVTRHPCLDLEQVWRAIPAPELPRRGAGGFALTSWQLDSSLSHFAHPLESDFWGVGPKTNALSHLIFIITPSRGSWNSPVSWDDWGFVFFPSLQASEQQGEDLKSYGLCSLYHCTL